MIESRDVHRALIAAYGALAGVVSVLQENRPQLFHGEVADIHAVVIVEERW